MTEQNPQTPVLTKEERAFLVKNLWEALQVPSWTKDDLIDLGKAIFAKKTLREMGVDEKLFARIFPLLVKIADHLGEKIVHAQNPAPTPSTVETPPTPPTPASTQSTPTQPAPTITQPPMIASPAPSTIAPPTSTPPAAPLALVPLLDGQPSKN